MWFPFALVFALTSSVGVLIAKKIMEKTDEYFFLFVGSVLTLPFLLLIIITFYQIPEVDGTFVLSVVASSGIGVIAAVLAYRAIKIADISLVAPLAAFSPVFTTFFSLLFLKESVDLKGWLGILTIVAGAYLLELSKARSDIMAPFKALYLNKGVQYSFVAYFLWSITPIFEKTAILHTSPQVPAFASLGGMAVTTLAFGFLLPIFSKTESKFIAAKKFLPLFLLGGLLGGVGLVSAFTAFSLTNLGFAEAVFKLSAVFTVILGWLFLKERNVKERLLGSIVMLSGVTLLVL